MEGPHLAPQEVTDTTRSWDNLALKSYLDELPWQPVQAFYQALVSGAANWSDLGAKLEDLPACCASQWPMQGRKEEEEEEEEKVTRAHSEDDGNESAKARKRKRERKTYRIGVAYDGAEFDGYMKQEGSASVQECVERALTPLLAGAEPIPQ
ncbi:hypothetical protein CYMTET_50942 [Cymbomonas tetramitiformis]|uniref:tRNA pseudouridine synthase n=1 Tax=Cymbomonas tetramitiformis TaxID=36881 RepID=A0AAE0BNS9_9CHLO|nr:hypothetical protein CYMTET_50942 [Cymbomonas tetramitiformis]